MWKNRDIICVYFGRIRILTGKVLSNEPSQKVYEFMHIYKIKIEPRVVR